MTENNNKLPYNNFNMTLEECRLVFDNIKNLVIVDEKGNLKYLSPGMFPMIEAYNKKAIPTTVVGKHISEVHPATKITEALKDKNFDNVCFYFASDVTNIAKIKTLTKDGKIVGAIDYDIFTDGIDLKEFLDDVFNYTQKGFVNLKDTFESMYETSKKDKPIKYCVTDIIGNSAAIPENLFESELFGYEEGSFTGAKKSGSAGKFEMADQSTIFLDEVDQLPYHIQPKLLRVLQEREVTRIGGKTKPIDIRVIAATNKDLWKMVKDGKFREDLYYRLNVVEINIPSLCERPEDIPLLAEYQLKKLNRRMTKNVKYISPEVMELFKNYDWPGNVRELNNILEHAMNICQGDTLKSEHLGSFVSRVIANQVEIDYSSESPLETIRMKAEAQAIKRTLELTKNNRSLAAKILKISRTSLYDKILKYNI